MFVVFGATNILLVTYFIREQQMDSPLGRSFTCKFFKEFFNPNPIPKFWIMQINKIMNSSTFFKLINK